MSHAGADRRFKLWFNYSQHSTELAGSASSKKNRRHVMKVAEDEIKRLVDVHGDNFDVEFVAEGPVVIP
jgi:hypothetical protein